MRPRIMTLPNTSQGPMKSISTAPSEIRKATGMLPCAGGLSGLVAAWLRTLATARENGMAEIRPRAEDLSRSLRFIVSFLFDSIVCPSNVRLRRLRPLQQVTRTGQRDNFFETLGFGGGDFAAVRRQPVIAAALVVVGQGALAALDDQAIVEQALDDAVERAGAEFDFATGAHLDFLEDGVAVEVVAG